MTHIRRLRRAPERGSAMIVTIIITAALLAGGVVLVSMQQSSNRGTDLTRGSLSALHCAEGGLAAARQLVAQNYMQWGAALTAGGEPSWLQSPAVDHDLDNDGNDDFILELKDNDDEVAPTALDPLVDKDLRIFILSTCTKYPETPKQISELITFTGGGQAYENQKNGAGGNNNRQ